MQMNLKLIPLDIPALRNEWPRMQKGITKLMRYCADGTTYNALYNEIWAGEVLIWKAEIEGEYVGFLATKIITKRFCPNKLFIYMAFACRHLDDEIIPEAMQQMDELAKQTQCPTMEFESIRDKSFEKVLAPFGWKAKRTIFSREVV